MIKVTMKLDKSTKGTHVYKSTDDKPAVTSVYIQRDALPSNPPININIHIELP